MKVYENILISSITTMKIGGPARYVIEIETPGDIPAAYEFAAAYGLHTFVLGGGANTIGHDGTFHGAILINRMKGMAEAATEGGGIFLKVMGGEEWDNVVRYACERGFTGIEALSKIPGTAGAAPVQNIGAYGQEIARVFDSAEVYDTLTKTFTVLRAGDMGFSYRRSLLNTSQRDRYFIVSVTLRLREGQMRRPFYNSVEQYVADHGVTDFSPVGIREMVSAIRAEKVPDPATHPSAGSFFKNIYLGDEQAEKAQEKGYPVHRGTDGNKINAGWLIERAGLAGKLIYGMRVSEKSALILVNESANSYANLAKARGIIVGKVYDMFGYWLEQEPVEIPANY